MAQPLHAEEVAPAEVLLGGLLDSWTPVEHVDGVLVVRGRVGQTALIVFTTDRRRQGGALGRDGCAAVVRATDRAVGEHVPVVGLWHSGGARLGEGVAGLDGVARLFAAQTRASGQVLQVSVIVGPAAGGAAYGAALGDLVILGPAGRIFVTGPQVVRAVTSEAVDAERLGGRLTQARSGVLHRHADTDTEALADTRRLVQLVTHPGWVALPPSPGPDPSGLVPHEHRLAYDVRRVASSLLDRATFLELQAEWAPNVVVGLGRLAGRSVGVLCNQPQWLAGCLDAAGSDKASRFVQWCDAMGLPLVCLVDVPGYLPGVAQEEGGVVRRGAKLLHAYAASSVPRITLVLRKAFGGGYIAMGSKGLGADLVLAWPGAHIDVMGAEAAAEVLHRRELAATPPTRRPARLAALAALHAEHSGGLSRALAIGAVDEIVTPAQTRPRLAEALQALQATRPSRRANPLSETSRSILTPF